MKNQKLIFLGLTLFLSAFLFQNAISQEIEWGQMQKAKSKKYYPSIISVDDNSIYTYAKLKKDYLVEKYNKNGMSLDYSTEITPEKVGRYKSELEKVVFSNNKYIIFASYYDRKQKESVIYSYIIDGNSGQKTKDNTEIFRVPVEKKRRSGNFYVFTSKDKNKILVNHYGYYKKQKRYKDRFKLFDNNLNVITEREDIMSESENYTTHNYIIDNDGSIYFFKKYDTGKFNIASYDADKEYEKWEEPVDLTKHGLDRTGVLTDMHFSLNSEGNILVTGYYAKDKEMEGCFLLKIDKESKEVLLTNVNKFDEDFKKQFLNKRQKKKGKDGKVSNDFHSIRIIPKEDGGIIQIGEMYKEYNYYRNGGQYAHRELWLDLIVLNLDEKGNLIWANRVPKKQVYMSNWGTWPFVYGTWGVSLFAWPSAIKFTQYYSYLSGITDDKLHIIYNDHPKNAERKSDHERLKSLKRTKKMTVTKFTIDLKTGEKEKDMLMGAHDFQVYLKPIVYHQEKQGDEIITFGKKRKDYKFGTLNF